MQSKEPSISKDVGVPTSKSLVRSQDGSVHRMY